ncbi:RelA/SpoT family protein [Rothia halotolerans]|uniref:RelA/SpoT family protein n=1 Tax=Rothia halotolerans TaxID=405770 RepID=UPI001EDF50A0
MSASTRTPERRAFPRAQLSDPGVIGSDPHRPVSPVLVPLLRAVKANNPGEDLSTIERAFAVADRCHTGQKRKSGDPYITHPVAVTTILAELGASGATLIAGLLHDTVEDTDYTLEQLTADFGAEVAELVDGVTKLDKVTYGEHAQAETVRKMVIAMAKDIRVLVIKLADRLHNARTWRFVSRESSSRKAKETLEIFAPLAHRLGINTIKWELEDLSFAALEPRIYDEIVRMVGDRTPERERQLRQIRSEVIDELASSKIACDVTGRPKHYYSIYQKMILRDKEFDEIYDLLAIRVLVDSVRDCYAALGVIHEVWKPLPGRFKDYIAVPKFNTYQSLHTAVIGPNGRAVEVQIRTHEMHQKAEYGIAAHWKYKAAARGEASADRSSADETAEGMKWLQSLMSWQSETKDSSEFLDSLRYEVNAQEVFVFTPAGDVLSLPAGSTPVDFAYSIHTQVGDHTIGARVNGKLVPLSSKLQHGDRIEILTTKADDAGPSEDWLKFVASPRARTKIRHYLTKERREGAIEKGKENLTRSMRRHSLPLQKLLTSKLLVSVAEEHHKTDVAALYEAVGEGQIKAQEVIDRLVDLLGGQTGTEEDLEEETSITTKSRPQFGDSGVIVEGADGVYTKLARCCTPVPPDEIMGIVTRGNGISVHRVDCPNMRQAQDDPRRIAVQWAPTKSSVFLVEIQVEALDRRSLLSDVTRVLSESHVNILSANVHTNVSRLAISRFSFEMGDPRYLDHVLSTVRNIDGVYDVYRITGSRPTS